MFYLREIFYLLLLQISVSQSQTRTVGGISTTIKQAPFMVQIFDGEYFVCGGTLAATRFVITAAHCVVNTPLDRFTVVAGASKIHGRGIASKVTKIMRPRAYSNVTDHMDVAVMKLSTPLEGESIQPIGLCSKQWKGSNRVQLYGWGTRGENDQFIPNQLHTVNVKVISKRRCARMYGKQAHLTDSMFCAAAKGKDACSGDSGGPAIINGKLCGVISWGFGCARPRYPGVYANLLRMRKFIKNCMQE